MKRRLRAAALTDEADGAAEVGAQVLRPVVADGDPHVGESVQVFEGVLHLLSHVQDVVDVVLDQAVQVFGVLLIAKVHEVCDLHREQVGVGGTVGQLFPGLREAKRLQPEQRAVFSLAHAVLGAADGLEGSEPT